MNTKPGPIVLPYDPSLYTLEQARLATAVANWLSEWCNREARTPGQCRGPFFLFALPEGGD